MGLGDTATSTPAPAGVKDRMWALDGQIKSIEHALRTVKQGNEDKVEQKAKGKERQQVRGSRRAENTVIVAACWTCHHDNNHKCSVKFVETSQFG